MHDQDLRRELLAGLVEPVKPGKLAEGEVVRHPDGERVTVTKVIKRRDAVLKRTSYRIYLDRPLANGQEYTTVYPTDTFYRYLAPEHADPKEA